MNKKLIATAVAGALITPATTMAATMEEGGPVVTPYFRIANSLDYKDVDGGRSQVDVHNVSSRIGLKGSQDLGNGMTVFGQYEFSTFTDHEGTVGGRGGINDTRIGIVGMKGAFGSVALGNQWSAFYNTVGTYMDPTYTLGYYIYSSQAGGPYRESNALTYTNTFGPVHLQIDGRMSADKQAGPGSPDVEKLGNDNGKDFLDGFGIGASFAPMDMLTLAAAYDVEAYDNADDEKRFGVAGKADFAGFYAMAGYMTDKKGDAGIDNKYWSVYLGTNLGGANMYIGYQTNNNQADYNPDAVLLHADYKVGGGPLRLFYEGAFYSGDNNPDNPDFNENMVGMRIDF